MPRPTKGQSPHDRSIGTQSQRRLLAEFEQATRDHAYIGAAMPEAHEEIQEAFDTSRANLLAMLDKARPRRTPTAKLYVWRSQALADHTNGQLLAVATGIDLARKMVRKHIEVFLREHYTQLFTDDDIDNPARIANMFFAIEEDLLAEPVVRDVLFIEGSE